MSLRGVCAWTWRGAQQTLLKITSILTPAPNGERYLRVGGTREHRFDGTSLEPRKLPENAASPTRRVHAVLGALLDFYEHLTDRLDYSSRVFIWDRMTTFNKNQFAHWGEMSQLFLCFQPKPG